MIRLAVLLVLLLASSSAEARTIMLKEGNNPAFHLRNEHDVTLKCAQPGTCIINGGGSSITDSSNITIDGVVFKGGVMGLQITDSDNVTVQNSTFIEQTSAGISVNPGSGSHNVVIRNNEFKNDKAGCNYLNPSDCDGEHNGGPVSNMDYGVRVYGDTTTIEISGNHFSSLFNHAISLKSGVDAANIVDNTFDSCGRNCIELGQDGPVGTVYVGRNKLHGRALKGIYIRDVRKVTIVDNDIQITGVAIYVKSGNYGAPEIVKNGGTEVQIDAPPAAPPEPPYVYTPPVFETPEARRARVMAEGGREHSCCDDLSEDSASAAEQMRLSLQGGGSTAASQTRMRMQAGNP